jgi:hypothetical protein
VTLNADTAITATFAALLPGMVQLSIRTAGQGSVEVEPLGPYEMAQMVTLTAVPASGWQFDAWDGGVVGASNPTTLTITADEIVTATFAALSSQIHKLYLGAVSYQPSTAAVDVDRLP